MFSLIKRNFFVLLFICSSLAVVLVVIFTVTAMNNSARTLEESTKSQLVALSRAAALMVDAEELDEFDVPADMEKSSYIALKQKLIDFTEISGLEYTYYIRYLPETDMWRFIIDNTPVNYTALSEPPLPGEPSTVLALLGTANAVDLGSYSDGWEGYMSAFAPVYNKDGTPSNYIAGVDMIDVYIRRDYNNFRYLEVMLAATVLVVIAAGVMSLIMYQRKARQSISASVSKTAFLANMSHEMRTPMNAIIGMVEIAHKSDDLMQIKKCLDKIDSAAVHLLGIINDVLDISKIEAGKLTVSLTEFNMDRMLKSVLNVVEFKIADKRQILNVDVAEDVPKALISDEQRIAQVLSNLLSNAVKFTPDEGIIDVSIRKLSEADGQCILQFNVKDSGIGIDPDQQSKLFRAFEQADDSISRRFGGTGLGLSISKRIVGMLGGDIRVESEPGHGSLFSFTVKATIGDESKFVGGTAKTAVYTADSQIDHSEGVQPYKGKRMLLAEDIEINQEIMLALLEDTGIAIDVANNGMRALGMFSAEPRKYDIVFMDIHMPDMDGYTATERIRALDDPWAAEVPIIAMTANVFKEDVDKCLECGMNDHLGKPINIDEMLRKLDLYLLGSNYINFRHST